MPERTPVESVLVVGSDDWTAAVCRVARSEGAWVVLITADPTASDHADSVYLEPVTAEFVEQVVTREHPDVLLVAAGCPAAVALHDSGVLAAHGAELIGVRALAAETSEYRVEVVRDRFDTVVVVEVVEIGALAATAPAMTATDADVASMRDVGVAAVRAAGVVGGCAARFAADSADRTAVVELTAGTTWSSVLAASATGFPIAEATTRIALGHGLDRIVARFPERVVVRVDSVTTTGRTHAEALRAVAGCSDLDDLPSAVAGIDRAFAESLAVDRRIAEDLAAEPRLTPTLLRAAVEHGFSDTRVGDLRGLSGDVVREIRHVLGVRPVLGSPARVESREQPVVVVVGGSGAESAHSSNQAAATLRAAGHEVVVVPAETGIAAVLAETSAGPVAGVVLQFGGACAAELAPALARHGIAVLGTPRSAVDLAERCGRPRPSESAVAVDVEALYDGHELYVGGVVEHVERLGVHDGPGARVSPPISLGVADVTRLRAVAESTVRSIGVRGLARLRFAVTSDGPHLFAVEPFASRTTPFVAAATGVSLAGAAARIALGASIERLRAEGVLEREGDGGTSGSDTLISVWEPDTSRSAVMGVDSTFGGAYAKARIAAHGSVPTKGRAFVHFADADRRAAVLPTRVLVGHDFDLLATAATAGFLRRNGITAAVVGARDVARLIADGQVDLVVDTSRLVAPGVGSVEAFAALVQCVDALRSGAPIGVLPPRRVSVAEARRG